MTNADNSTDKYCTKTKTLWSERHRESQIICHIIRHTMRPVVTVQALPKMPFGTRSQVGPRNHVLGGDPNPPGRRNNFWRGHLPAIVKYREYLTWVKVIRYVAAVMQPITISTAVNDEYHADVAHMDYKECTEPTLSSTVRRCSWGWSGIERLRRPGCPPPNHPTQYLDTSILVRWKWPKAPGRQH